MTETSPIRIGARGSPLALAQAWAIAHALGAAHGFDAKDEAKLTVRAIKTQGDVVLDQALSAIGGKGLFTKEIDRAQLAGEIDIAVHSMKDLPTELPDGLILGATPAREDVRDAMISHRVRRLADLPAGAVVGTASLRRQAQTLWRRPDLTVVMFRGNVQTRLKKLADGAADVTFLAMAGLNRLGMTELATAPIDVDDMLPAVAQGALAITIRAGDARAASLIEPLHDPDAGVRVAAERAFLRRLDGSCRTPLAGLAELQDGGVRFRGEILKPDGSERVAAERFGGLGEAEALGLAVAEEVLAKGGPGFLATS